MPDAEDPRTIPESTATAEVFDPVTGTFSPVGSMAAPRFMHAASILPDGSVLVAAGAHDLGADGIPALTADAEIFDPSSGTFRATGTMHRPRLGPTAVPVGDRVLVLGHVYPPEDDQVIGISSEWFD